MTTQVEPYMQSLIAKTFEAYEASKTTLAPHVIKVKEFVDPYFQVLIISLNIVLYLPS